MELFTVSEVADKLKLTTKTIYTLIKEGKITAITFGGAIRITSNELERLLKEGA